MCPVDEVTKSRLAQNEVIFRSINEHVVALEERFGNGDGSFLCECADIACAEMVVLTLDEYERIHGDGSRFFVVPGHEQAEIESVVERRPSYLVVHKDVPVPSL